MEQEAFFRFLKRGGRSDAAARRCVKLALEFSTFVEEQHPGSSLEQAGPEDLEAFARWIEREPKGSAKTHLWALQYYYEFVDHDEMHELAGVMRRERIDKSPLRLKDFRGVNAAHVERIEEAGIRNVEDMLRAGSDHAGRRALAARACVPYELVLELVKLSDLARIPGIKGIRARLYYDAGVQTIEQLATWEPEELRIMLAEFVERTGFEGIAPLPKETASGVARARALPRIVDFSDPPSSSPAGTDP